MPRMVSYIETNVRLILYNSINIADFYKQKIFLSLGKM